MFNGRVQVAVTIYLGLGSNLGDRRANLRAALAMLAKESVHVLRVSPVVESPALLPADAAPDWNMPFLNLVAECESELAPEALLERTRRIETVLGRSGLRRWAPRPIDIDILLYDDLQFETGKLKIPHPGIAERAFVLTPLTALDPQLLIPGTGSSAMALNAAKQRIPQWMGIVNVTPDSFSDGGEHQHWPDIEARIDEMCAHGVHWLDFGAESTRPGAKPLTADQEWTRLEPVLGRVIDKFRDDLLRPGISIDTYHPEVAARALELGINMINDVSGLTDPAMLELAAGSKAEFVAMHNLGLPADPARTLDTNGSAVAQIEEWLDEQIASWTTAGLDLARVVFDPGIGFGKTSLQALEVLRQIDCFNRRELRLLVGHSRKSFMKTFADDQRRERDLITIGASLALCEHGVDILRIHNLPDHVVAWRGWAHLQGP